MDMFKNVMVMSTIGVFNNSYTEQQMAEFKQYIDNMPLAEFIISISQQAPSLLSKGEGAYNFSQISTEKEINISGQINQASGLPVLDNTMFPTLPQGSKVNLEAKDLTDYQDGDILCYIVKGGERTHLPQSGFSES